MEQLTLRLGFAGCPHGEYVPSIDRVICRKDGRELWVECHKSICGEAPKCVDDPIDNSTEAKARRVRWMEEHHA